jgi:hypothetical protein
MPEIFIDPASIALPEVYKFAGRGGCLEPLIPEGSTFIMSRRATPAVGDLVAVWFARGVFTTGGNFKGKILMALSDDTITLAQTSPQTVITFGRESILDFQKVVGVILPSGGRIRAPRDLIRVAASRPTLLPFSATQEI